GAVEGTSYNVSNTAGSYSWQVLENIVVEDGQMTFTFDSSTTSRMGAIVIRQISSSETSSDDAETDDSKEDTGSTGSSEDAQSTETPSEDTQSTETPSEDATEAEDASTTDSTEADNTSTNIEDEQTPKSDTVEQAQTVETTETVAVTGVKLNKKKKTIRVGQTFQIETTVNPTNATNQEVTYKTSNSKVAKVDANGLVKAKKVGTATITVTTKDGSYSAKCKITVKKAIKVTSVKLNKSSKKIKLGKTYQLKAKVKPTNATVKDVTWKTSNSKIATVDSTGKVTALKKGTATITVKTKDGKHIAKCKITVK
ncbi:MAG: Ig-like domain-containing protein, partial [Butyrivibrio sp.]|nr:Ig-like domain-containing protein [Butyrivibrio sp.]